jgi:hypothetical protein
LSFGEFLLLFFLNEAVLNYWQSELQSWWFPVPGWLFRFVPPPGSDRWLLILAFFTLWPGWRLRTSPLLVGAELRVLLLLTLLLGTPGILQSGYTLIEALYTAPPYGVYHWAAVRVPEALGGVCWSLWSIGIWGAAVIATYKIDDLAGLRLPVPEGVSFARLRLLRTVSPPSRSWAIWHAIFIAAITPIAVGLPLALGPSYPPIESFRSMPVMVDAIHGKTLNTLHLFLARDGRVLKVRSDVGEANTREAFDLKSRVAVDTARQAANIVVSVHRGARFGDLVRLLDWMEDYGLGEIKLIDEPPQAAQGTE